MAGHGELVMASRGLRGAVEVFSWFHWLGCRWVMEVHSCSSWFWVLLVIDLGEWRPGGTDLQGQRGWRHWRAIGFGAWRYLVGGAGSGRVALERGYAA